MYHGTLSEFEVGDILTTKGAKKYLMAQGVKPVNAQHRELYVTGDWGMAKTMAAPDWTKGEKAHVYQVEPIGKGRFRVDPEVGSNGSNPTQSYTTRGKLRVVRKMQ